MPPADPEPGSGAGLRPWASRFSWFPLKYSRAKQQPDDRDLSKANGDININQVDYFGTQNPWRGPTGFGTVDFGAEIKLVFGSQQNTKMLSVQLKSKHIFPPILPTNNIIQQTEEEHEEQVEDRCNQHFTT